MGDTSQKRQKDFPEIKLEPSVLKFIDIEENQVYESTLKVTNTGKNRKWFKLQGPSTKNFSLEVKNPSSPQACGLGFTAKVTFSTNKVHDYADRLVLLCDSDVIEIPIFAYAPTAVLQVQPMVDFGLVVANSHFLSKEMRLMNLGSKAAPFEITYKGNKQIQITPQTGMLCPNKALKAEVKLFTGTPGIIREKVEVHLEGADQDMEVIITANIVEQAIKVMRYEDVRQEQNCVNFGPVYYGTDRIEPAWVFNDSPEPVKWVTILDEGCPGEEAGTNLTLTTAAIMATECTQAMRGKAYDVLTSLVTVFPNQGILNPYQRVPIYFRFSPRFNVPTIGWESKEKPPPRQDFALFISFEIVGSKNSFTDRAGGVKRRFEVGITATALPVLLNIKPLNKFDFGELACSEQASTRCTLYNESAILPLDLKFRKVSQFNVFPKSAHIKPGYSKEFVISFQPNQAGEFRKVQLIEALGRVFRNADDEGNEAGEAVFAYMCFQTIPVQLFGKSLLDPAWLNAKVSDNVKKMKMKQRDGINIASVNDRPTSIRPADHQLLPVETPLTRQSRHTYVDRDFAFTRKEEQQKVANDNKYVALIRSAYDERMRKLANAEHLRYSDRVDIGLKPGKGLAPLKLRLGDVERQQVIDNIKKPPIRGDRRLLNTKDLAEEEENARAKPVIEGLNAIPISKQEKMDCSRQLTPKELFKVVVGPPLVDFGEVCTRSSTRKEISILNNLDQYISFEINIKFKELRQTSPLAQIIPPKSQAKLSLVFESTCEGQFDRSLKYTINSHHKSHLLVKALVVPVQLRLSTEFLEVCPEPGAPVDAAFRSTVTLYNDRNYPAEFTWSPVLGEKGTAFTIRPACGVVNSFKSLKCEVVFHQSYNAPLEGEFRLKVLEGKSLKLVCLARLGTSPVQFLEKKLSFGNVPLNLSTRKTTTMVNNGPNNAMFCVANCTPIENMRVYPAHGIIPTGGSTELTIVYEPTSLIKYDAFIEVLIRGWKSLELRFNGVVEEPKVDINLPEFKYHGVYCGSWQTIPFKMVNKGQTAVRIELDMSRYEDFTFAYESEDSEEKSSGGQKRSEDEEEGSRVHCFEIGARATLPCTLKFHPTSVAGYDFVLPFVMNKTPALSPSPSMMPVEASESLEKASAKRKNSMPPQTHVVTPKRRVQATALRQPLLISETNFKFSLPVSYMEMSVPDNAGGDRKVIVLENQSETPVPWKLGMSTVKGLMSKDTAFVFLKQGGADFGHNKVQGVVGAGETYKLTVVFCPRKVDSYVCEIPFYINDDTAKPYRTITLDASMVQSAIKFEPSILSLSPVPLSNASTGTFHIVATGFFKSTGLRWRMEKPKNEHEDCDYSKYFQVTFPNGLQINPSPIGSKGATRNTLMASVRFCSTVPISKCLNLIFTDDLNREHTMVVTATTDNCLLTTYPFLALHRREYKIVCDEQATYANNNNNYDGDDSDDEMNGTGTVKAVQLHLNGESDRMSQMSRNISSTTTSRFNASSSSYITSTEPDNTDNADEKLKRLYIVKDGEKNGGGIIKEGSVCFPTEVLCSEPAGFGNIKVESSADDSAETESDLSSARPKTGESRLTVTNPVRPDSRFSSAKLERVASCIFPPDHRPDSAFHAEVVSTLQSWYSLFGWTSPFALTVPDKIRDVISKFTFKMDDSGDKAPSSTLTNPKTLYDMVMNLSGRALPGITLSQPLPFNIRERVKQLHWQHATLLTFVRSQGGAVSSIRPEYLMSPVDYRAWCRFKMEIGADSGGGKTSVKLQDESTKSGTSSGAQAAGSDTSVSTCNESLAPRGDRSEAMLSSAVFELVSKRAWTDLLLQIYKVFVLSRVTYEQHAAMRSPYRAHPFPVINASTQASNIYSVSERIVLSWLNHNYEHARAVSSLWHGAPPPSRWVVNFDLDLLDGLVLIATLAAYCPWLGEECFSDVYTSPNTPEQCLHNTLLVVKALKSIGLNYHIQATDITDPNPITMLFLVVYLYQHLPVYLPKAKIEFVGGLTQFVKRKVIVQNPGGKPVKYTCKIFGRDGGDFTVASGRDLHVVSRGNSSVEVVFKSRLLRPAEAYLVLTSRYEFPMHGEQDHKIDLAVGSTIVFELQTIVNHIEPVRIVEAQSPCYELTRVQVPVSNPYNKGAEFTIVITEPKLNQPDQSDLSGAASGKKSGRKSAGNDADRLSGLLSPDVRSRLNSYASYSGEESMGEGEGGVAQSEMASFYCRQRSVWIEPLGRANVVLSYLPLNMGKHFCTVLLVNEQVGELVYAVEGEAGLPLPSPLRLNLNSPHSADMDEETKRTRNWQENVLYWKCPVNSTLYERLHIPVTNPSKERALRLAAQQHMSGEERRRRALTGTHQSGTLAASIAMRSRKEQEETGVGAYRTVFFKAPQARYKVQTSNKAFEVPGTVLAPTPLATGPTPATEMRANNIKPNSIQPDGTFGLDLKFTSEGAGLYASEIFLRSASDVRLYRIECVVHPSGTRASIDFSTPANQALTQNIPIQNSSNHDWFLECKITGKSFSGPGCIAVKAQETAQYPLTFHPNCECVVDGTLKISNKADGLEHNIELHGVGETSLAIETIKIRCKCRSTLTRTVTVPNFSRGTLNYGVYSDLAFLDGASSLLVPRHKSAEYAFTLAPQQRGTMRGVLMFVADDVECDPAEPDSDDDEPPPCDDDSESEKIRAETPSFNRPTGGSEDKVDGQKVWFGIQVDVEPSDPISTFELECSAHGTRTVTIPIENPTGDEINCTVQIMGEYLSTQETIRLLPKMPGQLPITFAPLCVGTFDGSVVFDSPGTGEFWYKLVARATTPAPVALPTMDSALGGISRQPITLRNMLDEVMVVEVKVDNKANFTFDLSTNDETGLQQVKVQPNAKLDVLLQFSPTQLGLHTHKAKIEFTSTQLGTQVYHASGRGLAPMLMEPMSISAGIGATTSLTLPFRNPTDVGVLLDIRLTENDETLSKVSKSFIRRSVTSEPGFALVEKHTSNVRVAPHESLDIMFSFSPRKMMKYLASISLSIKRQDGEAWPEEYESSEERSKNESELALASMGRDSQGWVRSIRWLYPIHGIPVLPPTTGSSSGGGEEEAVLECQARSRMEERLEVSLTGAVPSVGARKSLIRLLGARGADRNSSGGQIIDGLTLNEEFHFEFFYASERSKNQVERSLSVELIGKDRDPSSGIVILTFKLLFSPYFTMNEVSQLSVTSINGGSWSFPLRIRATEPPPDDRITIVATAVGEASVVSFKLNSQAGHPTPFEAYFTSDSDKEFEISPRSGQLQPDGSEGTLLTIAFTPSSYGRKFRGLLVVKATDMQWSYAVRGKFPKYEPPKVKSRLDLGPLKLKRGDPKQCGEDEEKRKKSSNFMQRNIRLLTTAASSPIKGRPING